MPLTDSGAAEPVAELEGEGGPVDGLKRASAEDAAVDGYESVLKALAALESR